MSKLKGPRENRIGQAHDRQGKKTSDFSSAKMEKGLPEENWESYEAVVWKRCNLRPGPYIEK